MTYPMTKDGREIRFDIAGKAVDRLRKLIDAVGFVAPECAGEDASRRLPAIAAVMDEIAEALKLTKPKDWTP